MEILLIIQFTNKENQSNRKKSFMVLRAEDVGSFKTQKDAASTPCLCKQKNRRYVDLAFDLYFHLIVQKGVIGNFFQCCTR